MNKISARAEVVTRRTYCRPLNDKGTKFETWEQVCDRVISHQRWLWERALTHINNRHLELKDVKPSIDGWVTLDSKQDNELNMLRDILVNRRGVPSGRTLWLGGTDIAKNREASMFNPLKHDEEFITDKGVFSFDDFDDGDVVKVATHEGRFKPAVIKYAGKRDMVDIEFGRFKNRHTVSSCVDHSWILSNGEKVLASELKVGDKIIKSPLSDFYDYEFSDMSEAEQTWWCYGFVYGDGTMATSNGKDYTSRVRLCKNKQKFLDNFKACGFGYSFPPSCDGDPFVYTGTYDKSLPSDDASPNMIKAFLRGYLSADGNSKNNTSHEKIGIVTTSKLAYDFLKKWCPVFGLYIKSATPTSYDTNYGRFDGYKVSFYYTNKSEGVQLYVVKSIKPTQNEECWCLTVEDDASFILPSGIVTSNCAHVVVETSRDLVDSLWLLLQGCGVGFTPQVGTLSGFRHVIKDVEVIRTNRQRKGGKENNTETYINGVWTIQLGDSAEAWAKSIGKIMSGKYKADKVVLDFSQIRPSGERLKGYGWISSGDESLSVAFPAIIDIMNRRAGNLLTKIDILDIMNWMGTILSSRRSAEIALVEYGSKEWKEFADAKNGWWETDDNGKMKNPQRVQSNNSLVFYKKPSKDELLSLFDRMKKNGGSEPGFVNGESAISNAPWFRGGNPCFEILLGNKGFCNLVELDTAKYIGDSSGLFRDLKLLARANYRQTVVDLNDGILQQEWHLNNEFLRLCGVSITGIAQRDDLSPYDLKQMRNSAIVATYSMSNELDLQRPANTTTQKPSGTVSKIMDTTEGIHRPLGKYIFNWIKFSKSDPLCERMRDAGYREQIEPTDDTSTLFCFPVKYDNINFTTIETESHGIVEVNLESAIDQLNRYKKLQVNWCDQNCSNTISYDNEEVPQIVDWLLDNWDIYVGVSFLYRTDPTKSAKDLGYMYLPQEVVCANDYNDYISTITEIDFSHTDTFEELTDNDCSSGACPIK